jgi:hypothetical protein
MFRRLKSFLAPSIAVAGLLALSGCALPPVIAIASYAVNGISYMASGKSVSDYALSAVVERDCALFRVVMGDNICRDQGDPPVDGVAVALADGVKPWEIAPAAGGAPAPVRVPVSFEPDIGDSSGDFFDQSRVSPEPALALLDGPAEKGLRLDGLAPGTEIFALMQADGALEIFAHDPTRRNARENLRMIMRLDGYNEIGRSVEGVRMNGMYYAISDILA